MSRNKVCEEDKREKKELFLKLSVFQNTFCNSKTKKAAENFILLNASKIFLCILKLFSKTDHTLTLFPFKIIVVPKYRGGCGE